MEELLLQMGKRGTVVIPAKLRKRLGLEDGSLILLREKDGALELRLARAQAVLADPTPDPRFQLAQRMLSTAEGLGEYLAAIEEVRRMGFDPDQIPHERYSG